MKVLRQIDASSVESEKAKCVREYMHKHIIGQDAPIDYMVAMLERYHSGLYDHNRPINSILLLGPTGVGKTLSVQNLSQALLGTKLALIRIDCAEFSHDHEVAKLLGSPPGYIGYQEGATVITQAKLERFQNPDYKLGVILFDEIEKAHYNFWNLLLGILDNGTLTLGSNITLDLTKTLIFMTSNVGSQEMDKAVGIGRTGFSDSVVSQEELERTAMDAAKRKFMPEFINRLDKIIVFNTLLKSDMLKIVDLELNEVQTQLYSAAKFVFLRVTNIMKQKLVDEGYDPKYNARNICRVIEQRIQTPLARLIASGAVAEKDEVIFDYTNSGEYIIHVASEEVGKIQIERV